MKTLEEERREAIKRYLSGESAASICKDLERSKPWLYKWVNRYDPTVHEWSKDLSRAPHNVANKTPPKVEDIVLSLRDRLKKENLFYGPLAIQWSIEDLGYKNVPHINTIKQILKRHGKIEPRKSRSKYKSKNIPYPIIEHNGKPNIVHEMDFLGPRYLRGGFRFYSLDIMDVGTHRVDITISKNKCGYTIVNILLSAWQKLGISHYLQMDNQLPLTGSNRYPRAFGSVIRFCLYLNVTPVFIPIREPWRNGHIEKFQHTYQKMFLNKYHFDNPDELLRGSSNFENRHNDRYRYSCIDGQSPMQALLNSGCNIKKLPERFQVPDLKERPKQGYVHLVRFVRSNRVIPIFGEKFIVPKEVVYQYVKAIIDVKEQKLSFLIDDKVIDKVEYTYNKGREK